MIKEYKTIHEIASPLMIVDQVEGVTFDELCEIRLPDGLTTIGERAFWKSGIKGVFTLPGATLFAFQMVSMG